MRMIPCTENCLYQADGLCMLDQTIGALLQAVPNDRCLNFTPKSNQYSDGLSDVTDLD